VNIPLRDYMWVLRVF